MDRRSIFTFLLLIVAVVGLTIRVPRLGLRPMHADEAVQAARFRNLWQEGRYIYDPNEFHGPTLIYATLPVVFLGGDRTYADTTEATYRVVPVVFGAGLILLFWLLGDALGRWSTVCAAILAAISPAMVFYSRYYIHETLLAFFMLATISCSWRYLTSQRLVWCLAAGTCVGLMQATKETAAIAYLAAIAACGALALYMQWPGMWRQIRRRHGMRPRSPSANGCPRDKHSQPGTTDNTAMLRPGPWWHFAMAGSLAVVVATVLLSSFFTNLRGPLDAVLTYIPWLSRASGASPHVQPWYDYVHRLFWWRLDDGPVWSEGLIVTLAAVGFAASLLGGKRWLGDGHAGFIRWIGFYTCAMTAIYSAIAYKTPWCLVQFLLGMIILAGVGAAAILRAIRPIPARSLAVLILCALTGQLAWQALRTSYMFQADRRSPYVYAQTSPGAERLAERLKELAETSDEHWETRVKVVWNDQYYWPLPWYLRGFRNVELWRQLPADPAAPVVIASPHFDAELTARLSDTHIMTDFFEIRPQVLAQLWVRTDLWEAYLRQLGRI